MWLYKTLRSLGEGELVEQQNSLLAALGASVCTCILTNDFAPVVQWAKAYETRFPGVASSKIVENATWIRKQGRQRMLDYRKCNLKSKKSNASSSETVRKNRSG